MATTRTISSLPWRFILQLWTAIRATFFTYRRVETKYFVLQMGVGEVEKMLGKLHFTNDWEFSYFYRGEDLNMRRTFYKDDKYNWYQLHVRGFLSEDGSKIELQGHTELEPSKYPRKHMNDVNLNRKEAFKMLKELLDQEGVEYEVVSP